MLSEALPYLGPFGAALAPVGMGWWMGKRGGLRHCSLPLTCMKAWGISALLSAVLFGGCVFLWLYLMNLTEETWIHHPPLPSVLLPTSLAGALIALVPSHCLRLHHPTTSWRSGGTAKPLPRSPRCLQAIMSRIELMGYLVIAVLPAALAAGCLGYRSGRAGRPLAMSCVWAW